MVKTTIANDGKVTATTFVGALIGGELWHV